MILAEINPATTDIVFWAAVAIAALLWLVLDNLYGEIGDDDDN